MAGPLYLVHEENSVPLGDRAVAIGRLPECDLVLDGWEVSRRHARLVPTPAGPLLVDRSRFGTFVNNMQVVAPLLLVEGDVIRIGNAELRVAAVPPAGWTVRQTRAPGSRLLGWWKRYGVSESGGAVAALVGALWILRAGGGIVWAALAGTLGELIWFYGSLAVRDLRYEARTHRAAGRPFAGGAAATVVRNLGREFGVPEAIDLLLRPVCFGLGVLTLRGALGVVAGKLVADLLFYGPVLALCHWRLGERKGATAERQRLRPTIGAPLPLGQLAELHRRLESETPADSPKAPPTLSSDR